MPRKKAVETEELEKNTAMELPPEGTVGPEAVDQPPPDIPDAPDR